MASSERSPSSAATLVVEQDRSDQQANPPVPQPIFSYDRIFWLAYTANTILVTANAMTFRFAELISWLGGTERTAGVVVSVGVAGALFARLIIGRAIDQYGVRTIWAISSIVFAFACSGFLPHQTLGLNLYFARLCFASGLAGMFTCSIVHIQNRAPNERRTEVIGTLGSSGFVGMIIGARVGDLIFQAFPAPQRFLILFSACIALGVIYLVLTIFITKRDVHARPVESPSAIQLLRHHWPGPVVLVAFMMGLGFVVSSVFLTRFVTHRQLAGIGTFWTVYAIAAFLFRIASRRLSQRIGRHRMLIRGLIGLSVGHALLPLVTRDWHFCGPAICCGYGHALMFPAIVSLGSGAFPKEHRGVGTTVVLGFIELGQALSAPLLGQIIDMFSAGYSHMFLFSSICAAITAILYTHLVSPLDDTTETPSKLAG